jgi:hypothetical protein
MKVVSRNGFIQFLAILVLIVLGILILQFRFSSSHARFAAYQHEQGEIIRQICESALDEAFRKITLDIRDPDSETARNMVGLRTTPWAIPTPMASALANTTARTYWQPEVSVQASVVEFRGCDADGIRFFQSDSGSEGLGTIQLEARAQFLSRGGPTRSSPACAIFRHHDYQCVHSGYQEGYSGYQQTYPLRYALLVRHGLSEFRRTNGTSLNPPPGISLVIRQRDGTDGVLADGRRGKIFFGGTAGNDAPVLGNNETPMGNYVFLNLAPEDSVYLPGIPPDRIFPAPLGLSDIKAGGVILAFHLIQLFPPWFDVLPRKMPLAFGTFWCEMVPFVNFDASNDTLQEQKDAKLQAITTLSQQLTGAEANQNRGVQLIELAHEQADNPDFIRSIIEGDVRQRFMYFSALCVHLGLNGPDSMLPAIIALFNQVPILIPCVLAPPFDVSSVVQAWDEQQEQALALPLISTFSAELPLLSRIEFPCEKTSRRLMCAGAFPRPLFFAPDSTERPITSADALPFQYQALCSSVVSGMKGLQEAGAFDPQTGNLTLSGMIRVRDEPVILGEGGAEIRISGRGVIMAEKGIRILAGISKTSAEDGLVLLASDGTISVETPQLIQAALIAMNRNDSGKLSLQHPLNLHGLVAVDRLDLEKWVGANVITYDPVFLDLAGTFSLSLNRRISLNRVTMAEM